MRGSLTEAEHEYATQVLGPKKGRRLKRNRRPLSERQVARYLGVARTTLRRAMSAKPPKKSKAAQWVVLRREAKPFMTGKVERPYIPVFTYDSEGYIIIEADVFDLQDNLIDSLTFGIDHIHHSVIDALKDATAKWGAFLSRNESVKIVLNRILFAHA